MEDKYLYFGNLGRDERQYAIPNFIGLALRPTHGREIRHNAGVDRIPFPDSSIRKVQSQDVFEHVAFDRVPFVFDEVHRVLMPSGVFRLSVRDYRSPVLKRRSVYDSRARVIADLMMGGSVSYDEKSGQAKVRFTGDGSAHLWFPRHELVTDAIMRSSIRKSADIRSYQCFLDEDRYIMRDIPDDEMHVKRSVPHGRRANGAPASIVVDFAK